MSAHVLIMLLHLDSPLARAWSDLLPSRLRIEVSEDEPAALDVQPIHPHDAPRHVEEIATDRWRLSFETRQGRALRIAFRPERPAPRPHFDEIRAAFETIQAFASRLRDQEPYHFGLALGSRIMLEELWRREGLLRPALTPPFRTTLV
ncbi:MAG TPA: hypothetical protein VJ694_03770 [Patescibacteria group bacterium]|nr:hypothetical protein [Patescibacteria group bacterium]